MGQALSVYFGDGHRISIDANTPLTGDTIAWQLNLFCVGSNPYTWIKAKIPCEMNRSGTTNHDRNFPFNQTIL